MINSEKPNDSKIILYLETFMYELEQEMNKNLSFFDNIQFNSDEANTDHYLKRRIKDFILNHYNHTKVISEVYENGDKVTIIENKYQISDIKIADELTKDDKKYLYQNMDCVYTNPDLLFVLKSTNSEFKIPVEVKSTKEDKIPGSSIQQINMDGLVFFVKYRSNKVIEIVTGKYINSISGNIQFPDRSPRPQVSFNCLKTWNMEHRKNDGNSLVYKTDDQLYEKLSLLEDWQSVLARRWLGVLLHDRKNKEPWFNNNLRKFALIFLDYYEGLNAEERKKFEHKIKSNIREE